MRGTSKWILIVVIALAIAMAFYMAKKSESQKNEQIAAAPVPVLATIGALGRIEPRSRVIDLSHDAGPEGARIETLNVGESQTVRRGDVIAVFSDYPRKQARLDAARAQITVLQARIRAEAANQEFFKSDLSRGQKLRKAGAIPQSQFDEMLRNQGQSAGTLESLRAELTATQANELLAVRELEQARVTAPIDGTILKIHARPGERVGDGGIAQIADLSSLDIVAEIYERDMPRVKAGQKAEIKIPGQTQVFHGTVREIGFLVAKNDMNDTDPLADRDNRVVEVRISLDAAEVQQLQHLIYMQVDVRLL